MNWKKYSLINFEAACLLLNNVLPIWEHQLTFILISPKGSSNLSWFWGLWCRSPRPPLPLLLATHTKDGCSSGQITSRVISEDGLSWAMACCHTTGRLACKTHQIRGYPMIMSPEKSLNRDLPNHWFISTLLIKQGGQSTSKYIFFVLQVNSVVGLKLSSHIVLNETQTCCFFSCLVTFPPQKCQIKHLWSIGPRQRWATHVEVQSTWPQPLSLWMTPATLSSPTVERRPITWRPAVKWNVSAGSRPWNWPKPRRHACRPSQVKCKHRQNNNKRVFGVSWEKPSPFWCVFFAFLFPLIVNRRLGGRLSPGSTRTRWRIAEFRSSGCSQNTKQQGGGSQHLQRSNFKAWLCPPEVSLEQPIALFLSLSSRLLPETYTYECLTWKLHFKTFF